MAIFPCGSAIQPAAGAGGFYDHPIEQSLRLNDDDSAYLSWTPASAGSLTTWTVSLWFKRGNISSTQTILQTANSASPYESTDLIFASDKLRWTAKTTSERLETNQVLRDTSAWYHVVLTWDTTNATSSDRMRMYINGERVTSFSTANYPSLNQTSWWNTTNDTHILGKYEHGSSLFDGYLAEVHFIDGQALDATDFGETVSGAWKPIAYTGTYGTNGFYLDFADSADIGSDESGNGNDWTINSLAATDVVLDSPTNNFATLNPLDNSSYTLSEGNLKSYGATADFIKGTISVSSGKWYFENVVLTSSSNSVQFGVCRADDYAASYLGFTPDSWGYFADSSTHTGKPAHNSVLGSSLGAVSLNDIIGIAIDLDAGTFYVSKNGVWQNSADPVAGTGYIYSNLSGDIVPARGGLTSYAVHNFGQDSSFAGNKVAQGNTDDNGYGDFYYAPPTGYLALCTANIQNDMPASIDPLQGGSPQDHFNTVLWSGDNTYPRTITGVGFQPDLVWSKTRNYAYDHIVYDSVRGTGTSKSLTTNSTGVEGANAAYANLSDFDVDGFEVDTTSGTNVLNVSGGNFVAWNWKANGSGVSNTDGSITSTVSANTDAGFSIVSYTGNGTAGATIGHGLSSTPEMIIVKNRGTITGTTHDWMVYHSSNTSAPETDYLTLNSNNATADATVYWNDTAPTASVVTLGSGTNVNKNTEEHIAYCFHSVEGFSKFGSYTGNGSADGPFVYTGFRPAFVLVKRTNALADWQMFDNRRPAYNEINESLEPNNSVATQTHNIDFLSNGFKIRANQNVTNYSGSPIIYMAFAENPFKYANAR